MQLGAEVKKLIRGPGIFQRSCQKASTPQPLALEIEYGTGRKEERRALDGASSFLAISRPYSQGVKELKGSVSPWPHQGVSLGTRENLAQDVFSWNCLSKTKLLLFRFNG